MEADWVAALDVGIENVMSFFFGSSKEGRSELCVNGIVCA